MDLNVSDELNDLLKDNGFRIEEIQDIIENAESSGKKLKNAEGEVFIAKGVSDNLTTYAVYSPLSNGAFELKTAYAHKMNVAGLTGGSFVEVEYDDDSGWICHNCNETAVDRNVDMAYLDVSRPGPGIVCPKCGDVYISEGVTKTLKTAESILEEKRA
ncbi:hypothetical protein J7W08_04545 [Methanococcoides orientis]|uniref:DUF7479 domain-containing protein n=1 Tax=Methanococcoides orientis TaxID=2822137 RepID=UPI001E583902|nr:hypothetical protein [Methanococcoides orientis]UGV41562.1 hypothetical protein J7W08_04545 [Methanococcoides orientis]